MAEEHALPASLGLGASLVLLLSKSAAELSRMAELRAQMERLMLDVRADVRSCNGRPSGSDGHTDSASVVTEPFARAGGEDGAALSLSDDGSRTAAPAKTNGRSTPSGLAALSARRKARRALARSPAERSSRASTSLPSTMLGGSSGGVSPSRSGCRARRAAVGRPARTSSHERIS